MYFIIILQSVDVGDLEKVRAYGGWIPPWVRVLCTITPLSVLGTYD